MRPVIVAVSRSCAATIVASANGNSTMARICRAGTGSRDGIRRARFISCGSCEISGTPAATVPARYCIEEDRRPLLGIADHTAVQQLEKALRCRLLGMRQTRTGAK